jgi:hypothetical protein
MILSHNVVIKLNNFIQTYEPTPMSLMYAEILERNKFVIETIRTSPKNTYIQFDNTDIYGFYKSANHTLYMILRIKRLVIGYIIL